MSHEIVRILNRHVGAEANSVDARELHEVLGVGRDFSNWVKTRIDELGLVEHVDFEVFAERGENPTGGRPRFEYVLTLDAAKHIALAERSEMGRTVRAYFIEAEKRLHQPVDPVSLLGDPTVLRQLLGSYAERVQALEATVAEAAPKVAIYDRAIDSGDTFGFREACQQIRAATGAGENETRGLMRARGWIQRLGGQLAPAHTGLDRGYVTTRERVFTDRDGANRVRPELRITPKGIARAIELLIRSEAA